MRPARRMVSGADAARETVPASVERNRCPHTDFAPLGAAGWLHAVMGAYPQPDVAGAPPKPGARLRSRDRPTRLGWSEIGVPTLVSLRWGQPGGLPLRNWAAGGVAAAGVEVGLLRHHHLAAEDADQRAVLVVPARLDMDDPAVVLAGRLPLLQHRRLAVDRVAVERRRHVTQRLDLEVGDRLARHVRHRHPDEQ